MHNRGKRKHITMGQVVLYLVLGAFTLMCLLPLVLIVIVSLSTAASIDSKGFSFFPDGWSLDAYRYVASFGEKIARAYLVTIFQSVAGTVWTIFLCSMFGYVLSRKNFRLRGGLSVFLLITMLFHGGGMADFIIKSGVYHLRNNLLVLILPGVSAYTCFVMKSFIQSNVPDSLVESAKMYGAGEFYIYLRIVLPLIVPAGAAMGFMQFVGHWNSWQQAYLYLDKPEYATLQLLLMQIEKNIDYLRQNMSNLSPEQLIELSKMPAVPTRMAILLVTLGPIMIAYPFFQKYFIKGIVVGAVKG